VRFYDIAITNPQTNQVVRPASLASLNLPTTFTSYVNGQSIPGALNVEIAVNVSIASEPFGDSYIKIWGVSLQEISQGSDLNNALIVVQGGFQKGLPLANPKQKGVLFSGYIIQAFGNWVGTDQTVDLVVASGKGPKGIGSPTQPVNLTLNWSKGTQLGLALKNALLTAYPGCSCQDTTSQNLVLSSNQVGIYNSLTELSQWAYRVSRSIITTAGYNGVSINADVASTSSFIISDGTQTQSNVTTLNFNDFIGQPTWFAPGKISFKCPMRADLKVGDQIKFPVGNNGQSAIQSFTTAASQSQARSKSAFQGTFQIQKVRHIGNFRQRSGDSWVTTYEVATVVPGTNS